MSPRTRMFKALGGLVISMIAGASFLSLLRPGTLGSLRNAPILLAANTQESTPKKSRWNGIDLITVAVPSDIPDADLPAHLFIGPTGELRVNQAWSEVIGPDGADDRLTICIEAPVEVAGFSADQFDVLHSMLDYLAADYGLTADDAYFFSFHPAIARWPG